MLLKHTGGIGESGVLKNSSSERWTRSVVVLARDEPTMMKLGTGEAL